jgi:hypothetical protein
MRTQATAASRTARVADGHDYEVRYTTKKTGASRAAVKKAVKKRRQQPEEKVERRLS